MNRAKRPSGRDAGHITSAHERMHSPKAGSPDGERSGGVPGSRWPIAILVEPVLLPPAELLAEQRRWGRHEAGWRLGGWQDQADVVAEHVAGDVHA